MKKIKFVILSSRQTCGGPIVLHALCKHLHDLGYNAKIIYTDKYWIKKGKKERIKWYRTYVKDFFHDTGMLIKASFISEKKSGVDRKYTGYINVPIKGCRRKFLPFVSKDTIVIYPEVVYGNPLRAKNVVRYLLSYNRYVGKERKAYGKNDLFVAYREVFNDINLNPDVNLMKVPYFDLNLYKRTNYGERNGKCYIIRKGRDRKDLPESFDGIVIDDYNDKKIVEIFNKCSTCISYDTQTAYSAIAAMCGCLSIVVPEEGKTREDYMSNGERKRGRAYGFEQSEIDFAESTKDEIRGIYEGLNNSGREEVIRFISIVEKHFGL